ATSTAPLVAPFRSQNCVSCIARQIALSGAPVTRYGAPPDRHRGVVSLGFAARSQQRSPETCRLSRSHSHSHSLSQKSGAGGAEASELPTSARVGTGLKAHRGSPRRGSRAHAETRSWSLR